MTKDVDGKEDGEIGDNPEDEKIISNSVKSEKIVDQKKEKIKEQTNKKVNKR